MLKEEEYSRYTGKITRIFVQKFKEKKNVEIWNEVDRNFLIAWHEVNLFDRDILDGSCNPLIALYKDDYVFLIVAYEYVLYLIWSIIGILMPIPGEQRSIAFTYVSPPRVLFALHSTSYHRFAISLSPASWCTMQGRKTRRLLTGS